MNDLIFKFINTSEEPLVIFIDPPVIDYILEAGESLKLKIIGYKAEAQDVSDIVDVRYEKDTIYIDLNYSFTTMVEKDGEEEIIWGWPDKE
ncbi:hypothetical protein HHL17_16125 [Chitinophaga sp. G-6-1-13]|uniref:Uncharacterized protein n=1 Tax=Chitinophaga fulva TaxID=2728842 RepID=A0A848GLD4_9BACT|nr:hypothetical protein [Chitinophaga fulva]NML38737.1 hypothetical protein [Chitinophaga fulva]